MKSLEMFGLVALLTIAPACAGASSTSGADNGNDAGTADAAATGDGAQACNALSPGVQPVDIHYVGGDPPEPQGGAINDGTYVVTDVAIYTGAAAPSGPTGKVKMALKVNGSSAQIARMRDTDKSPDLVNAAIVTSGTILTTTDTCPDTNTQKVGYTATPTTITTMLPVDALSDGGTSTIVEVFTKQ